MATFTAPEAEISSLLVDQLIDAGTETPPEITAEFIADLFLTHHLLPVGSSYYSNGWYPDPLAALSAGKKTEPVVYACAIGALLVESGDVEQLKRVSLASIDALHNRVAKAYCVTVQFALGIDDGFTRASGSRVVLADNRDLRDADYRRGLRIGKQTWDLVIAHAST